MTKRLVALLSAAVIVIAACSPPAGTPGASGPQASGVTPTSAAGQPREDQTLKLYLSDTDPPDLNPALAQDSVSLAVLSATQRGLLYFDEKLGAVPSLAEALPEVSDGGQTLTFKLRAAQYADGEDIVAGDFVRQFKRLLDPRNAAPYSYIACDIAGANALLGQAGGCPGDVVDPPTDDATIDGLLEEIGVEATDDSTVVVRLERPATYFTTIMAMWVAVPVQEDWESFSEAADLGASGPFQITEWSHNSLIVLEPNPNWYGTKPTLTRVELNIGGDPQAALASFESGDIDMVTVSDPANYRQVEQNPELQPLIQDVAQLAITYYNFNNCGAGDDKCPDQTGTANGKSATQNKNFRIALTQAFNRQQFIDLTFGGIGQVANSMVMPGIPGYDAELNPYPYDPDAAQASMATALTELGVTDTNADGEVTAADLGPMRFGYNCNAGHLPRVAFIAEAWRTTFGLTEGQFDISCSDFATFLDERHAGAYHVARNGWGADFPHAKNQLDLFVCGSGNNDGQYCNPEFDRIFNEAATEADPAAQEQLYKDAQKIMVDDAAALFMRYGLSRFLVRPYVGGVISTPGVFQNLGDNFLESIVMLEE
jgi:oligopeptide transport system substrate-binding protein